MARAIVKVTAEQLDAFVRSLGYVPIEPLEDCFPCSPWVKGTDLRLISDDSCEIDGENQSFYLTWEQGDEPNGAYITDAPVTFAESLDL